MNTTLEWIKTISACLTPLAIFATGIFINRKLEKNKIALSKEKDWQISWAKLLFDTSCELNENITLIITTLFEVQRAEGKMENQLWANFREYRSKISVLEWNIRNYTQFAAIHGSTVIKKQQSILSQIDSLLANKGGDIEPIRTTQFEFNEAVRKAHAEILNLNDDKHLASA